MTAQVASVGEGVARSGWTWRRVLALALCLVVLGLSLRPHHADASACPPNAGVSALDCGGAPDDAPGGAAHHCAQCTCVGLAITTVEASHPAIVPAPLRFASGARGGPDHDVLPNPPPPRT